MVFKCDVSIEVIFLKRKCSSSLLADKRGENERKLCLSSAASMFHNCCNITTRLKYTTVLSYYPKYSLTCDFQQCGILTSVDSDEPQCSLLLSLETPNDVWSVA